MEEDPAIMRMNIQHYRALLGLNIDDKKRKTIERLLSEAEARLKLNEPDIDS